MNLQLLNNYSDVNILSLDWDGPDPDDPNDDNNNKTVNDNKSETQGGADVEDPK
jgi:hypothetical protein